MPVNWCWKLALTLRLVRQSTVSNSTTTPLHTLTTSGSHATMRSQVKSCLHLVRPLVIIALAVRLVVKEVFHYNNTGRTDVEALVDSCQLVEI